MKVNTNIKAGSWTNHNEVLVSSGRSNSLKVRTGIKAGALTKNQNEKLSRDNRSKNLTVKTNVKAGGWTNHNEKLIRTK